MDCPDNFSSMYSMPNQFHFYVLQGLLLPLRDLRVVHRALPAMLGSAMFVLSGGTYAMPDENMQLLRAMSMAADSLDYSGEFVFVKDGKISSMKISHIQASSSNSSQQKLMALDGSMREIILQDDEVSCVLPDEGMGMRERRQSTQPFQFNISDKVEDIHQHYDLHRKGQSRVAGRDCNVLEVTPKDQYRYGYQLCIDTENALLLKSELTAEDGRLLESYMFVNIEFGTTDTALLTSETPPKQLTWMDDSDSASSLDDHDTTQKADDAHKWRVADNTSGFKLEQYIERISPIMQAEVTHLVLGDGLANVSVFIARANSSANKGKKSLQMGSLNSYTLERPPYMITAIGEVPSETVTMIAKSTQVKANP